ncbi:RNA polymerase sigma factor [Streptomyces sp. YIM 98790]|uniref:RNA polymerase sigma factor n=1 Tax=Streptomyces sp. YIM 98790 TaxID=2689077 RepID=UPI00140BD65A|nr:sigma-70 family RNA polymerase sigma factor [Streptomyces sp. YIM 98790]
MASPDPPDTLLVVRCQLGERDAFAELVRLWHPPLRRYLHSLAGSPHAVDDLAQEAWIAVVRGLPRLRQPDRFAPWLFTIARRTVADHLRRRTGPAPGGADGGADGDAAGLAEDDDPLAGVLDALELRAGLDGLPPPEREVLVLFHLRDLPLAACAAVLDVPPGTVKSRLHRARRMLRRTLTERGYQP